MLSALVDGELGGAELDRVNAHVAACGACRVEANALRRLKHELRLLAKEADVSGCDDVTERLLALASQGGQDCPVPVRYLGRERGASRATPSLRRLIRGRRRRYVLWSAVSLVIVGIGSAAFSMGGEPASPGPQITPQLEVFDLQHALLPGDALFASPADVSRRVPEVASTP